MECPYYIQIIKVIKIKNDFYLHSFQIQMHILVTFKNIRSLIEDIIKEFDTEIDYNTDKIEGEQGIMENKIYEMIRGHRSRFGIEYQKKEQRLDAYRPTQRHGSKNKIRETSSMRLELLAALSLNAPETGMPAKS